MKEHPVDNRNAAILRHKEQKAGEDERPFENAPAAA
jgi:hypothetical protein